MTDRMHNRTKLAVLALGGASFTCTLPAESADLSYLYSFQSRVGSSATFNVSGPATGSSPDVQGDAFLTSVLYPNSDTYIHYYRPSAVSDLSYTGDPRRFRVRGGTNITMGVSGDHILGGGHADEEDELSASDYASFEAMMLKAFRNPNLNSYVDMGGSGPRFTFTIKFERKVMDNNAGSDDFGEILYFERGAGSGNSWLKMRAVDADNNALGPWLVIGPNETVQTSPETVVYRSDQKMGTTSIDVSRLGVSEFEYLQISNDVMGEPAYAGGGDVAPDFKIMAVMTNESQMNEVAFD